MRTPGVSLEPLDGTCITHPGSVGTLRLLVRCTNGHDVPVGLQLEEPPAGWDVHVVPDHVRLDDAQRQVTATLAFAVPEDAPPGSAELTLEATYPDGRATVAFPVHVVPKKRWGRLAAVAGIAGGLTAAAYGALRWFRRG